MPYEWTPKARRAYIYGSISRETWQTMSGVDILDALRSVDMGIREADFYNIRRRKLTEFRRESEIEQLPRNEPVPMAQTEEMQEWELKKNLYYRIRVEGRDPETGMTKSRYVVVTTDEWRTIEDLEEYAKDIVVADPIHYEIELEAVSLVGAFHKRGFEFA